MLRIDVSHEKKGILIAIDFKISFSRPETSWNLSDGK